MSSSVKIDALYVVDTHALVWYLTGDNRLSPFGQSVFAAAKRHETRLIISVIVIAEMFYVDKKNGLFASFAQIYTNLKSESYIEIINFSADDVLNFDRDSSGLRCMTESSLD
jgi:PIN domain nuclease of toxin-antitoxin system